VIVWCAGLEAPPAVRAIAAEHGKGGRLVVDEHLEIPGHPGVFAVGDVAEIKDRSTGLLVPGTAQAALAEAPFAGRNIVAHLTGSPYVPFVYRERGIVVEVGRRRGAGTLGALTVWGRPAALLKALVDGEYRAAAARGREPPGL
jgi:NADH dehydrogenase